MDKKEYLEEVKKLLTITLLNYDKTLTEEEKITLAKMIMSYGESIEDLRTAFKNMIGNEVNFNIAKLRKHLPKPPKVDVVNDIFRSCGYSSKTAFEKFGIAGMKVWDKYGYRFRYDTNTTSSYQFMLKEAQKYYDELVEDVKVNKDHYEIETKRYKNKFGLETKGTIRIESKPIRSIETKSFASMITIKED